MINTESKKNLNKFFKSSIIIFKGLSFILLTFLYLFFIYWMRLFYYLGSDAFPYLYIFLLPPFLGGYFNRYLLKKTIILKALPLITAIVMFSIFIAFSSGILRFWGWFHDLGFTVILFVMAFLLFIYFGWLLKNRMGKIRRLIVPVVSLLIILATATQFYTSGYSKYYWIKEGAMSYLSKDIQDKSYQEILDYLYEYFAEEYPYVEYKNIDLSKIKKETQKELETIESDQNFILLVHKMFRKFQDGHLFVHIPHKSNKKDKVYIDTGIKPVNIKENCFIERILPDSPAEEVGLKPGVQIIEVNKKSVNHWGRNFYGLGGDTITLTIIDFNENEKIIKINLPEKSWKKPTPVITHKRLKNDYGYIKIKWMAVDMFSFVPSFDKALEKLWDTRGLIIDIRDNPGGAIILTDQLLGRFTKQKVNYGGINSRQGNFSPLYVMPRYPIYNTQVVLLINRGNFSAADFFAYAASHLNRIKLVGRPTGGVVSSPSTLLKLPGGAEAQLSGSGLTDTSGSYVVEDVGVQPDVNIPLNISDIKSGIDRDLLTAVEILDEGNKE